MNIKMKSSQSKERKKPTVLKKQQSVDVSNPEKKKKNRSNKHKGFSKHTQIAHGDGCRVGTMICDHCHKPIDKEPYMIVEYYDMHSRGNENDFNKIYHRKCCEHSYPHSWSVYDEERKAAAKRAASRDRMRLRLIKIIKAWNFNSDELFDDD